LNFFFKNMVWTFIMFYFQLVNGFSATMIFDYPLWMYYNILFTVFPVCVIGMLDKDVSARTALKIPQIYASSKKKQTLFTGKRFLLFVVNAIYISVLSFGVPFLMSLGGALPQGYDDDKKLIGNIIACYGIIVANFTALLYMHSWDIFGTTIILIEVLSFFIYIPCAKFFDPETPDLEVILKMPIFWIGLLLVMALFLLPYIIIRFAQSMFNPSDLTIVKEMEHYRIKYPRDYEAGRVDSTDSTNTNNQVTSPTTSGFSDRDTVPLKKALSAPILSTNSRHLLQKKKSFYDTMTKIESSNTGYAFSYNDVSSDRDDAQEIVTENGRIKLFASKTMVIPSHKFGSCNTK